MNLMQIHSTPAFRASLVGLSLVFGAPAFAAGASADADAAITSKVQSALAADKRLQVKSPLQVQTQDGVVSLVGDVSSASMVYRAVEVTRGVEGVKDVDTHRLDAR